MRPRIEVYSIDECFLDLAGVRDPTALGLEIARTVRQWTGIPVAVGIAPTKTLAKLANRLAKKGLGPAGPVLDWSALPDPAAVLAAVPVEDLWGIAAGFGARLREIGIADARALSAADPRRLRPRFGVVVERVGWELRGRSCLPLACVAPPRQQVMVSRSFGARGARSGRAAGRRDGLRHPRRGEAARPGARRPGADGLRPDRPVRDRPSLLCLFR